MITAKELKFIANLTKIFRSSNSLTRLIITHLNETLEYNAKTYGSFEYVYNYNNDSLKHLICDKSHVYVSDDINFDIILEYYTKLGYYFNSNHCNFIQIISQYEN